MPPAIKMFSKSLTDTDTKKRLAIPIKILPDLPDFNGNHAVKIHLTYETKVWPIVCSVRKNGYKKPVFSGGWRNFVTYNNFKVGDKFTLYKVLDEAGSSYYRAEVDNQARPSRDLSPRVLSLNNDVDDTVGRSRTQVRDFVHEQEQLLKVVDAPIKEEGRAIMELAKVAADAPVLFVEHVTSKPSYWIFGTNLSDKATSKAHFKTELETEIKFFGIAKGICKGEPQLHSYHMTKEEREIKFSGLAEGCAMAYGITQAPGEACYKRSKTLSLDFVQGQATSYAGKVNLNLTLAPPIMN